MRHLTLTFLLISLFLSCHSQQNDRTGNFRTVRLTDNYKLVFRDYNDEFKLWKYPLIIKNQKDSLKIQGWQDEYGSELFIKLSPNKKYFLIDAIVKGFVYSSEGDSVLQENYFCLIVDIAGSTIKHSMQEHCSGSWNERSEWVSGGVKIFPLHNFKIEKHEVEELNNRAYYLEQLGKYEEAISILEKIVEQFPDRMVAYINLGDAYWGNHEKEKAKNTYQIYTKMMRERGKDAKIPMRVWERIK